MFENPTKPEIEAFLRRIGSVAVLGLSETPGKPSHHVAHELQKFGYRIVPVNPTAKEILGERAWPDLESALRGAGPVDVVDVFRRPEHVAAIVDDAPSALLTGGLAGAVPFTQMMGTSGRVPAFK